MSDQLKQIRDRIDALDTRLVKLLSARARLAQRIGRLKENAAYRPEREAQVLRGILAGNRGPLADAALARKRYPQAVRELEAALQLEPDNAELAVKLAEAYLGTGNAEKAHKQLQRVLDKDPDHPKARQLLKGTERR